MLLGLEMSVHRDDVAVLRHCLLSRGMLVLLTCLWLSGKRRWLRFQLGLHLDGALVDGGAAPSFLRLRLVYCLLLSRQDNRRRR